MEHLLSWLILIAVMVFVLWLVFSNNKEKPRHWPALPEDAFVFGMPATEEDVIAGKAAFVSDASLFSPKLDIAIPQYGYFLDRTFYYLNRKTPIILIQAEENEEMTVVGFRNLRTGKIESVPLDYVHLLGKTAPQKFEPYS